MSIKEEIDKESGKADTVKDKPSKVEPKEKEVQEEKTTDPSTQKQTGKA